MDDLTNGHKVCNLKQAVRTTGMSYKYLQRLLQEGRVVGAFKEGREWWMAHPVHIVRPDGYEYRLEKAQPCRKAKLGYA